jgi:restriction system protein
MGAFWLSRIELITALSEQAGYKSGLALTRSEIQAHLRDYSEYVMGTDDERLRIRSEVYEYMIAQLLYKLGNIPTPEPMFPVAALYHKYKRNKANNKLREQVINLFIEMFPPKQAAGGEHREPLDATAYCLEALRRFGPKGGKMAFEFVEMLQVAIHSRPASSFRRIEWRDEAQLSELFLSENLNTYYGKFFDQRFVDYLYRNFDRIDEINWRKFEGMTCEYFDKEGFHVEIGKGRNDDSIDARIWPHKPDKETPPAILVQCKREQRKVGKVVVKALWADVVEEKAKSGLIVTTSSLSPGAKKVSVARAYPIRFVDRETLRAWIAKMRSINTGIFMGQ